MENLIDSLINEGWLKTPGIIRAFKKIKRADFLPENLKDLSESNQALPIGFSQTISQPLVVAFMLEKLEPEKGEKIMDIGSGSGWTTALLSEIVGEKGRVVALELLPELMDFGKKNTEKYGFVKEGRTVFVCADGSKGYPDMSSCPELVEGFDKILCSAEVPRKIPENWKKQLKPGGKIVTPMSSSIWLLNKDRNHKDKFEEIEFPGFSFVPLVIN